MPDTNQHPSAASSTTETRARTTKPGSSSAIEPNPKSEPPRSAHFILQGKGGVGKSFVASLIAQYLADHGRLQGCFDTDPVNGSLQSIPALAAEPVDLLTKNAINVKEVDRLIQGILTAKLDVVVDNGAASFLSLSRYLIENDIAAVLRGLNISMVVHTVITGGANGMDTLKGLETLIKAFAPGAQIVVWVNEFFGPARYKGHDFEHTAIYHENRSQIAGLVYLRQLDPEMFAPNLADMLNRSMTFAEAAASDEFMLMEKSRLFRIKDAIWQQLATVL